MFLHRQIYQHIRQMNEDILDLEFRISKLEKAIKPAKKTAKKGAK